MYQQSIEDAPKKVMALLEAAEYFQIAGLKEVCSRLLIERMALRP
jgi:BTB/POZ domain